MLTRARIVCGKWIDTWWESASTQTVSCSRNRTISALCGRTADPLLQSKASSKPFVLLADDLAAVWWSKCDFYGNRHTMQTPNPPPPNCNASERLKINLKKSSRIDKHTWKSIVLLALIPVSISCVMDLPVMSGRCDQIWADRFPYYHSAPAASRALRVKPRWRLNIVQVKPWFLPTDSDGGGNQEKGCEGLWKCEKKVCTALILTEMMFLLLIFAVQSRFCDRSCAQVWKNPP